MNPVARILFASVLAKPGAVTVNGTFFAGTPGKLWKMRKENGRRRLARTSR